MTSGTNPAGSETLISYFAGLNRILIMGRGPSALDPSLRPQDYDGVMVADPTYALRDVFAGNPVAVLIGDSSNVLDRMADRYLAEHSPDSPLIMSAYIPCAPPVDFKAYRLPSPVPIRPLLQETGLYEYQPGKPFPTSGVLMTLLAAALGKECHVVGIDLYRHPSGQTYVGKGGVEPAQPGLWPAKHSEETELYHLRKAQKRLGAKLKIGGVAGSVLA
jgi:hypothetical protein